MKLAALGLLIFIALSTTLPAPVSGLRIASPVVDVNLALGSRKHGSGNFHSSAAAAASLSVGNDAGATVMIDMDYRKNISSTLYGIFFEEIGHAGDGGLYAELVQDLPLRQQLQLQGSREMAKMGQPSSRLT